MLKWMKVLPLLCLAGISNGAVWGEDLARLLTAPIKIERGADVTQTLLREEKGKLFLDASINGVSREFIFDTGSPTLLSKELAEELGLEIVGEITGTDAHGAEVVSRVAVVDTISIADVTFHKVPVLVFDFSTLSLAPCLIDGGVLGSEILPGSAWRMDLEAGTLRIGNSAKSVGVGKDALSGKLYDFGYPHAPVTDYKVGKLKDKAMFDTGSAASVALYEALLEDKSVMSNLKVLEKGFGSPGESAGGKANNERLNRFSLEGLTIGKTALEEQLSISRTKAPTLLGVGLLNAFHITLDYDKKKFLLEPRANPEAEKPRNDFYLAFKNGVVYVAQLFDETLAHKAGIEVGDEVLAVDEKNTTFATDEEKCAIADWLADGFDTRSVKAVTVLRNNKEIQLPIQ